MPILLAPLILAYLMLLGIACAALVARRVPSPIVLVTPVMGLGVVLALALSLSRMGLPIASFALALTLGLAFVAAGVVAWRRPQIEWTELRSLAIPILAGMALAGAPIAAFGFAYVGNANADMGLYVNSAANLLRHGFFDVPDFETLRSNADAARNAWFYQILPPNRYGADVLIALTAAVFRVPTYEMYMVLETATFGALIAATGALVLDLGSRVRTYLTAAAIAIANPLMLYTIYQQLLPQLLGQAAIVAVAALVQAGTRGVATLQRGVAIGCTATALLLVYPEISPFLVLGGITAPFVLLRHRGELRPVLLEWARAAAGALATGLVLLNVQLFTVAATLGVLFRIGAMVTNEGIGTINYYLVPSAFANLWGFAPFEGLAEPWLTLGILAGFFAFAAVLVAAVRSLPRGRYADGMTVGLLLVLLSLFARRSGYGLFKLAFLLQPFFAPFIAAALIAAGAFVSGRLRIPQTAAVAAALVVAIAATVFSSLDYLGSTADVFARENANYTELHAASSDGLYEQLDRIERDYAASEPRVAFDSDVLLPDLATLEGAAFYGHPLRYATLDAYANNFGAIDKPTVAAIVGWPQGSRAAASRNGEERKNIFKQRKVTVGGEIIGAYVPPGPAPAGGDVLIETGSNLSVLNRSADDSDFDVRAVRWRDVHQRLNLVYSDLGFPPYTKVTKYAIGPVEPDPFDRRSTVATLGPSMLLEVVGAEPTIRLRLDLTATLNPDHADALPPLIVTGASTVHVDNLGNGAARIETPPVRPLSAFGRRYVALRFATQPVHFVRRRSWLMSLFGRDVDLEPRRFALYGRDMSVASGRPAAPSTIARFPQDLLDRSLLFSGIYEDGWLSGKVSARLHAPAGGFFHLRVNVPPAAVDHVVALSIDGRPVQDFIARPSTYVDLQLKSPGAGDHDVTLLATNLAAIGPRDSRRIWGRLEEMSFRPDITGPGVEMVDDAQWYPFETYENRTFRWTKGAVRFRLDPSRSRRVLRLAVAPGPSAGGRVAVSLAVAGKVTRVTVDRERQIDVGVPRSARPLDVVLDRRSGTLPTANDARDLTLRVFSATLTAAGAGR